MDGSPPSGLREPIGQQPVLDQLGRMIVRRAIPHALLFIGEEGIGKRVVARHFAHQLLSIRSPASDGSDSDVSGSESRAQRIADESRLLGFGNHPDLHFLFRPPEKRDISVEQIRGMTSALRLKPFYGAASICIIDDAHEMSISACNALLLTLEEPPPHGFFVLLTHAPQRLPATILSRCQSIFFPGLKPEALNAILAGVVPELSEPVRRSVLELCDSSLGPLGLAPFIAPATGNISDEKRALEHLSTLGAQLASIRNQLRKFFVGTNADGSASGGRPGDALALASSLAAHLDGDTGQLTWQVLHGVLRENLRSTSPEHVAHWAELLLGSLRSEKLIRERNTNATLQLTNLLLQHS